MSDFFLELFSEEIPPKLQTNARKKLFLDIDNFFQAEDGIRDPLWSRGLGDVYKRQMQRRQPVKMQLLPPLQVTTAAES